MPILYCKNVLKEIIFVADKGYVWLAERRKRYGSLFI